jgi:hypothetical protein
VGQFGTMQAGKQSDLVVLERSPGARIAEGTQNQADFTRTARHDPS